MISSNEENSSAKMTQICEHGQILMTINNLYYKVQKKENWQIVEMIKKDVEVEPAEAQKTFDDIEEVVDKAIRQLDQIQRFTNSFTRLKAIYKDNQLNKERLVA